MTQILKNLSEPSEFWAYFEKISKIPRCSGNEKQIRLYIKSKAEQFGFKTNEDSVGNLVVKIPTTINKPKMKVILQCHLDMVCEKNEGIPHDFSKDPINLKIIEANGEKWITAEGTTLGADNGVGIAYLLTLMKKIHNKELIFNNIAFDLLFTVDEESGLVGALKIDKNLIDGEILINLDSEEDDTFTIGCAGGITTTAEIKDKNIFNNVKETNLIPMSLSIKGLIGGHSGVDIHKERGNALKLISKILWKLNKKFNIDIISINGGNLDNAIPRESNAIILVNKKNESKINNLVNQIKSEIITEVSKVEQNLVIRINTISDQKFHKKLSVDIKNKLLDLLYVIPNGPISYHPEDKTLVYTSTNLASIRINEYSIKIVTSQRSLSEISKKNIYEKIEAIFELSDLNFDIQHIKEYFGWKPDWNSPLLQKSKQIYINLFKEEPKILVIHAGLECGVLKQHHPHINMISIGPDIKGVHSPDECLKANSIEKIWKFLIELLKKIV